MCKTKSYALPLTKRQINKYIQAQIFAAIRKTTKTQRLILIKKTFVAVAVN